MTDALKKIEALEKELAQLRAQVEAQNKKKWEPEGGFYYINGQGLVMQGETAAGWLSFGMERKTEPEALEDAVIYRKFHRLVTWLRETEGSFDGNSSYTYKISDRFSVVVRGNISVLRQLAEQIAKGEVVL